MDWQKVPMESELGGLHVRRQKDGQWFAVEPIPGALGCINCMVLKLIGDFVGTYMLIFAGCAAIILNINKVNVVTLPGIASVWGLLVMVLIYSGAHFNPAVTIAFATSPGECLTSPACTGECNIIEPAKALISETNPPKYKSFS